MSDLKGVMEKELKDSYVKECKRKWSLFKDRLEPYIVYDDETMENCNDYEIWYNIMNEAKKAGIRLNETKRVMKNRVEKESVKIEPIKSLSEYSNDDLKKLYKSCITYNVTEWFRHRKIYAHDQIISSLDVSNCSQDDLRFLNICKINNILNKLEKSKDDASLLNEKFALEVCNEVLFWCAGGFVQVKEFYDKGMAVQNPVDLYNELHEFDDEDIEFGKATKFDVYLFIWNTLRFCSAEELGKLLKLADKNFVIYDDAGRPKSNKKIYKYDRFGNLVATFENRQECIEKECMGKSCLSNVISGKRKAWHGYKYVEKEVSL